jgi:geranylgeranyl diphosphate synthase type II
MNPEAFDLPAYLSAVGARVTAAIDDCLPGTEPGNRLDEAMRYSLMAGGKRIRPALCLAASEAVGGHTLAALPVACALEMIHTYSLIHDDLPAMDDDDMRRGRPTCHVAFDEATAILAGDALLTLAFEIIASMNSCPPGVAAAVLREVAAAAGRRGMVAGQMLDMQSEGRRLSLGELEELHGLKTGAMMEAALVCGAMVGGGSPLQTTALRSYGKAVGLAFQVVDDILNVEGDPAVLGKAVGTDRLRKKNSYPVLMGLDRSRELARDLMNTAVGALAAFDSKADPLRAIARYVVERKK